VYPAFWAEARNLGDPAVIAALLAEAGLEAEGLLAAAAQPVVKQELRATTEEAVGRGVFGAPSFFVGEEMFFGADRLPFVERALEAQGTAERRSP
jgi:2-hydroxychromene-2-carboxylate isomerase